jgi:glycolate oxidase iron-sulfur subunit
MQTFLSDSFRQTEAGREADAILRSCVHCGFCNATCPTYQLLGDERDGPRGRIYLIKEMLEGQAPTRETQQHLDRCLTCRACETTCPSGVEYGKLADFGRELLENQLERPVPDRIQRRLLSAVVPYPGRFLAALRLGRFFSFLLPGKLRKKIPPVQTRKPVPAGTHARKVLLLDGCAQFAATPATNDAARRVLDRLGITAEAVPGSGCCGAMSYHLSEHEEAKKFIRRNIDALIPGIRDGAEYVVSSASGCGVMLKDYGVVMADDPEYAEAAMQVSERTVDLCELLWNEDLSGLGNAGESQVALHCPCTLTHGQGLSPKLRDVLLRCGIELTQTGDDHLCCGSAGTYSVLQPEMSQRLLSKKLDALTIGSPDRIVTANVGCQLHLGTESSVPVSHWIELLDR